MAGLDAPAAPVVGRGGLDIEPDARVYQQIMDNPWGLVPMLLPRLLDRNRPHRSRAAYRELVNRIRADGWAVENFQFPLIADWRRRPCHGSPSCPEPSSGSDSVLCVATFLSQTQGDDRLTRG